MQIKVTVSVSESSYVKHEARGNILMQRDRTAQENIFFFLDQSDGQWPISQVVEDLQQSRALWKTSQSFHEAERLCSRGPTNVFHMPGTRLTETEH